MITAAALIVKRQRLVAAWPNIGAVVPFVLISMAGLIGPLRQILPGETANGVLIIGAVWFVIQAPPTAYLASPVQVLLAGLLFLFTLTGSPIFVQDIAYAILTVIYIAAFIAAFRISPRIAILSALIPIATVMAASIVAYWATGTGGRMYGIAGSWSVLQTGMYGTLGIFLLLAWRWPVKILTPILAILMGGVILTASRSAVLAVAVGAMVTTFMYGGISRRAAVIVITTAVLAGVMIVGVGDMSALSRLSMWSLDAIRGQAISEALASATVIGEGIRHSFIPGSSDSVVFILAETGYLGAAIAAAIMFLTGRAYLRAIRFRLGDTVLLSMAAAFVALLAIELFHDYILEQHLLFWLPVAYIIARGAAWQESR